MKNIIRKGLGGAAAVLAFAALVMVNVHAPAVSAPASAAAMQAVAGGTMCGALGGIGLISTIVACTGNPVAAGIAIGCTVIGAFCC